MCGICMGVCWCVWVCAGVLGLRSGVLGCARVCMVVHRCMQMYIHVCGCNWVCAGGWVWYARVCMGVCGSVRKCEGVCKCVCWMNFQNIFWRLDSIHQRTLIRILYEFYPSFFIYIWASVRPISFFSYWPIPIQNDNSHF